MSIVYRLKQASQKAENFAQKKQLREAVMIAEKALNDWAEKPSFWEYLLAKVLIGDLVAKLITWRTYIATAEKLRAEAQELLWSEICDIDPWKTQALTNAISLYQRYCQIIYSQKVIYQIEEIEKVLQHKQRFCKLVQEGNLQLENGFFKQAITNYQAALELYNHDAIKILIAKAEIHVNQEQIHNSAIEKAQEAEIP